MGYRGLLKQRNFFLLWSGQFASAMGDYLHALAIMWLTLQITGSGMTMAMVLLSQVGPKVVFGLLGGGYADRWNRRLTMIVCDLIRGGAVLLIPLLYIAGELQTWHLFAIAFVMGSAACFFDPADQALLPMLVKKEELSAANGLIDATLRSCRIFMPVVLAGMTALMPLHLVFAVDSATFFLSCLTLWLMKVKEEPIDRKSRPPVWKEIGTMLKEQWRLPRIMLPTLAGVFGLMAWTGAYQIGIPMLSERHLDAGLGGYGLIIGVYGVGNVLGSLVFHRLPIRDKANWVMYGWGVTGGGFMVMAFTTHLYVALLGALITAMGGPVASLARNTMIQEEVASSQMGKVFSLGGTLVSIGIAVSLPISGPIFDATAPQTAFLGFGGFIVGMALVGRYLLHVASKRRGAVAESDSTHSV